MNPEFTVPNSLKPYTRKLDAGGVGLHLYDTGPVGNEPPLVLLHGLGDEADSWRKVFPLLMGHRRTVAPDLPGFGRSDHPRRAYTPDFFAETVGALLTALEIPKAVLVGSSMGAAVALRFAVHNPKLLSGLVLVDGPPVRGKINAAQLRFLTPGVGERMYTGLRASQDAAYATLGPYYHRLEALPPEDRAFLRERVWARVWSDEQMRAFFSTFRWAAWESLLGRPSPSELAKLSVPTRIIWGEHDQVAPLDSGKLLQGWIPGAELQVIPNCGHLPQQERPEELAGLLLS
ncbi:MAG: alpha/beta hydrolase [Meiothermus sp.]